MVRKDEQGNSLWRGAEAQLARASPDLGPGRGEHFSCSARLTLPGRCSDQASAPTDRSGIARQRHAVRAEAALGIAAHVLTNSIPVRHGQRESGDGSRYPDVPNRIPSPPYLTRCAAGESPSLRPRPFRHGAAGAAAALIGQRPPVTGDRGAGGRDRRIETILPRPLMFRPSMRALLLASSGANRKPSPPERIHRRSMT